MSIKTKLLCILIAVLIAKSPIDEEGNWIAVNAQLLDVAVIQTQSAKDMSVKYEGFTIQYIYQYFWQNTSYTGRDLVSQSKTSEVQLTSNELKHFMLSKHFNSDMEFRIWINLENPYQSFVNQPISK